MAGRILNYASGSCRGSWVQGPGCHAQALLRCLEDFVDTAQQSVPEIEGGASGQIDVSVAAPSTSAIEG